MAPNTITCLSCGASNPQNSEYCSNCGVSLSHEKDCPSCETKSPAAANFCVGCGFNFDDVQNPKHASSLSNRIFLQGLDLDNTADLATYNADVPYGFKAIIRLPIGAWEVRPEGTTFQDKQGMFESLLTKIKEALKSLAGKAKQQPTIYLVPDLELLPVARSSRTFSVPGRGEVQVAYNFWLGDDETDLDVFTQKYAASLLDKSIGEFATFATQELEGLYEALTEFGDPASEAWTIELKNRFRLATGITVSVSSPENAKFTHQYLELSAQTFEGACDKCAAPLTVGAKFCEVCGEAASSAEDIFMKRLADVEGEPLSFSLSLYSQESEETTSANFEKDFLAKCALALTPVVSKMSHDAISEPGAISRLDDTLNAEVPTAFNFLVKNIKILDVRTSKSDWMFNTKRLIDQQTEEFDGLRAQLAIEEAEFDYNQAVFDLALAKRDREIKRTSQISTRDVTEAQNAANKAQAMDAVAEANEKLQVDQRLRSLENDAKVVEKQRQISQDATTAERMEALDQQQHKADLELNETKAQIDKADLEASAKTRQQRQNDQVELDKVKGLNKLEQEQLDNAANRENDKLRLMAEIEAEMTRQDQQFEISKIAEMKGLSASEILAMQAAQLAKLSSSEKVAELVGKIADANMTNMSGAEMQNLYERLIEEKNKASADLLQAQQQSLDTTLKANQSLSDTLAKSSDTRLEGFKEASNSARSTNEKAMESMAKVATGVAQRKDAKETVLVACINGDCTHKFEVKAKKYCPLCGAKQ